MPLLRPILERLARGRRFRRRLPASFGRTELYVSPDAQLKYMKLGEDAFDADLLRIAREHVREDSHVWDIGANVGVFAFAAASIARRGGTLAVEADLWLAQLIRSSAALRSNAALNLRVLCAAVSDRNGAATFHIAARGRASSSLASTGGRSQSGGTREIITVPTLTLDTLLDTFDPPDMVKIDVEGAELMALRGAQRLLRDVRPVIYIEVGKEVADDVSDLLRAAGYRLFNGARPLDGQSPSELCAFNTLALP